jgi:TerD domain
LLGASSAFLPERLPVLPGVDKATVTVSWRTGPRGLDSSAFLLGSDGRVRSDADFIFYNQPAAPDGSVQHTGKSPAGSTTSEAIDLALDTVAVDVDRNRRCGWPAGVLSAGAHRWASHSSKVISPSWASGPGTSVRSLIRAPE